MAVPLHPVLPDEERGGGFTTSFERPKLGRLASLSAYRNFRGARPSHAIAGGLKAPRWSRLPVRPNSPRCSVTSSSSKAYLSACEAPLELEGIRTRSTPRLRKYSGS